MTKKVAVLLLLLSLAGCHYNDWEVIYEGTLVGVEYSEGSFLDPASWVVEFEDGTVDRVTSEGRGDPGTWVKGAVYIKMKNPYGDEKWRRKTQKSFQSGMYK